MSVDYAVRDIHNITPRTSTAKEASFNSFWRVDNTFYRA